MPHLATFAPSDLAERCSRNSGTDRVLAIAFGTTSIAGHRGPGSLWFITSFDVESGIVEGFLRVPDACDLFSEHGSIMVADLSDRFGLVVGYPGGLTMEDAFAGADNTDAEVFEMLRDLLGRG